MMLYFFSIFLLQTVFFKVVYGVEGKHTATPVDSTDKPLFLTNYIHSGDIKTARELSKMGRLPNALDVLGHSGFITVNKKLNSNLFFTFFPALNKDEKAPVMMWFQGGPGLSAFFGLFVEQGPFVLDKEMNATLRKYSWANEMHLLYVDNPVGTGFSFTDHYNGYVTNQEEMAEDLYEFLSQFFTLFPEYKGNEFYMSGESYAGKYIPAVGYKIHSMGNTSGINLKGMAIGNGVCDPVSQGDYGNYFYNLGLIDANQRSIIKNLTDSGIEAIKLEKYEEAAMVFIKLMLTSDLLPEVSLFKEFTGFEFFYNYLMTEPPEDFSYYKSYILLPETRKALHVGNLPFQSGIMALMHLISDIMKSEKPKIEILLDNYRMMFYSGQLDIMVPYPASVNFLSTLKWKYSADYKNSKRQIWRTPDGKDIAGYVHSVKDFLEVLVRNSGHIVPHDQPEVAFDLISKFVKNQNFS